MKKVCGAALLLTLVTLSASGREADFALGGGALLSLAGNTPSLGGNIMISPPVVPFLISIVYARSGGNNNFELTLDWWILRGDIVSRLGLYAGPGIGFGVGGSGSGGTIVILHARAPVGIRLMWWDFLELLVELPPGIQFILSPRFTPFFSFTSGLGVRFWL
jgi:hypothetical protein